MLSFFSVDPSLKDKLSAIARATYTHSRNLAYFVFTYKGLQALQEKLQGKSLQSHSFLAACVGGWLVFGENNNINSQVGMQPMYKCQHIDSHVNFSRHFYKLYDTCFEGAVGKIKEPNVYITQKCHQMPSLSY